MPKMKFIYTLIVWFCVICCHQYAPVDAYRIGVGRADCTGPPVEVVFMGYAHMNQRGHGIHLRQFARAFVVDNHGKRVAFVSVDGAMVSHPIKRDVLRKLQGRYGDMYDFNNVVISGTHSHGTPGGFMMYLLYDLTTFGFVPESYRALALGIYKSIVRAHESMQEGRIYVQETEIVDASINRSPTSYLNNPEEERAQYKHDTDKTMTQMKFVDVHGNAIGAFNWFAVHPTSMNNTNKFVTSDNVGYASILLETAMEPQSLPGQTKFVAAFSSANLGDVSPNIMGPKCEFSGDPCDLHTSSCPAHEGQCFSSGPGKDQFDSTKIIANRIFERALSMIRSTNGREVTGEIRSIHQFIDMPKAKAVYFNPKTKDREDVHGCSPAMGYSFAAGTTDGPGAFDFRQGTVTDNPLWNAVRDFLAPPTEDDVKCQSPKPILLATGRVKLPYAWQPTIVPTELLQIGDVVIVALPGEFTTMSGRRVRSAVRNAVLQAGGTDVQVILAGLSNIYTSYVTTPEEYEMQRYEAASTIFGPHTLTLYMEQYERLAYAMTRNETLDPGPSPIFLDDKVVSLMPPVFYDGTPFGKRFGDVTRQPAREYKRGSRMSVQFISGNPRNNLQHEKTYLTVELMRPNGAWIIVATDSSWETSFIWERTSLVLGHSHFDIFWEIPDNAAMGTYRIRHFGSARHIFGGVFQYEGKSRTFSVV